ncbi:MAG: adenylyltransferase/cytidyltransferase family protein [Candidatus Peribacteraceae bacterium]|nr:adenylyltransferase/cytidyltransferase family protein [Candidatus Peribacteraceae bacterium]
MPMLRIMVFGTFDHFHPGHKFVLDEAGKRGEVVVVVATDIHVQQIKGRAPDQDQSKRISILQSQYPIYTIALGDPQDFMVPITHYKPDLILLGYDQQMPPGVSIDDLPCPIERLAAFEPEKHKSSLRR